MCVEAPIQKKTKLSFFFKISCTSYHNKGQWATDMDCWKLIISCIHGNRSISCLVWNLTWRIKNLNYQERKYFYYFHICLICKCVSKHHYKIIQRTKSMMFWLTEKLFLYSLSTKVHVSEQAKKINGNFPSPLQLNVIQFPVLAWFKVNE